MMVYLLYSKAKEQTTAIRNNAGDLTSLMLNNKNSQTQKNTPFVAVDQLSSVAQSCLTLCDPMNRSTPGLPVHHQLPEFTQTHVHRVGDAIQPSHPLFVPFSCPQSFPASGFFQMSQLSTSGGQSIGVSSYHILKCR